MSHRTRTRHVICLRHPNLPTAYFNRPEASKTIENLPAWLPGPGNELISANVSYSMDGSIVTSHQTGIAYNLLADSVPDDLGGCRLLRVTPSGHIQEGKNSYHELKCKYTQNINAQKAVITMIEIIMQYEIRMGKVSFSPVEQQLPPSPVPPPPVTPQPNRQSPSRTANANDNDERKWINQAVGGLLQVCGTQQEEISGLNETCSKQLQVCDKLQEEISGLTETCSKQKETTTMLVGYVKHLNENIQEVDKKNDRERAKTNAEVAVLKTQLGELGDLVKSKLNLGGEEGREKPMDVDGDGDGNDGEIPPSSSIPPLPPHPSSTATADNTTPRKQHHPATTSSSNFAPTPGTFASNMGGTSMAPNTAGTSTFQFQSFQPPIRNHTTPAAAAAAAGGGGGVAAKTTFTVPPPTSTLRGTPTATATAAPPAANRSFSMGTPMAPNTAGTSTFQSQPPIRNHTTPAAAAAAGGGGGGDVAAKTTLTAPPPTSTLRGTPTATATAASPAVNRSFSMGTWDTKSKNKPRGILTPQQIIQKRSERNSARKLLGKGTKKGKGPVKSDNPFLRTQKQRKLSDKRMNAPSTGTPLKVSGSTTATPELPFNIQF